MDLTALVTCKDRDRNLRFCISSILACAPRPRILIIDFGSAVPITTEFPEIQIVRVTRNTAMFHKARAINIGLLRVKTPYTCITDADQVFQPNFFGVVKETLLKNKTAFVMCRTYFLKNTVEFKPFSSDGTFYESLLKQAKNDGLSMHGDGCCNGFLTKHAIKIHGYDESYIGYGGEDSDFALRAELYGLKKVWITNKTSMVHLPHDKKSAYYKKALFKANVVRYKKKVHSKQVIANSGIQWGKL